MKTPSSGAIRRFRQKIWTHYEGSGRKFPWRKTQNPYRILVSEVMLQQTQAGKRTEEKYRMFLKAFLTVEALARAPLSDVLRAWQGLGYNRRAKHLKEAAARIVRDFGGRVPKERRELEALPGIGRYTAGAIRAFAWGEPEVFLETNIRSVFIHEFFPRRRAVSDRDILPLVEKTLDKKNPREWYFALMDYGAHLKKVHRGMGRRSISYRPQSRFKGSDREIRGALIREIIRREVFSEKEIAELPYDIKRTRLQADRLVKEGMLRRKEGMLRLP